MSADRSIAELLASLCDETISPEEARRLDHLICTEPAVRRAYLEYIDLHARLSYRFHQPPETPSVEVVREQEVAERDEGLRSAADSESPPPVIVLDSSPARRGASFGLQAPVGSFLFSYTAAAVILGIALVIGWAWRISRIEQPSSPVLPQLAGSGEPKPEAPGVGRITGLADCRWTNSEFQVVAGDGVRLGQEYRLAAGYLEITYDSGAKVILQGPAKYVVESKDSGFLEIGRLTARVESRESKVESRGVRGERTANPSPSQLGIEPIASLAPRPSGLFTVRTPTAVVTDLGTEFGVEVSESGVTSSHVFLGKVEVLPITVPLDKRRPVVLGAGQFARIDTGGIALQRPKAIAERENNPALQFLRQMPHSQTPGTIDLLDIVSGGDGTGRAPGPGIDPSADAKDVVHYSDDRVGGRPYRGALRLNSGNSETFDIQAIRAVHPALAGPLQFRAVVAADSGLADVWVFVDGRPKDRRAALRPEDGPVTVAVNLPADARFLTLACTETDPKAGGKSRLVIGDPVLRPASPQGGPPEAGSAKQGARVKDDRGGIP